MKKQTSENPLEKDRYPGSKLTDTNSENERRKFIDPNQGPKHKRK